MPELLTALNTLPRHAYPFLWADYVELLCLCSRNGFISSGNWQAQMQEAADVQADTLPNDEDHGIPDQDADVRMDDRVSARWADIHQRFEARRQNYPGWPFTLEPKVLRSCFDEKNPSHRLYAALLIASSLRLCHKKRSGEVAAAFEEIAYHWLRQSLNEHWVVKPFGAHQRLPDAYDGTLFDKLKALAADIHATLMKSPEDYDPLNTGDAGFDLVAWLDIGDQRGNIPVIFGQCACSPTDWESKQLDVTQAASEAHLAPQHPGAAYCFVPHDLSAGDKHWQRASHIKRTVVVDRLRLLSLFNKCTTWDKLPDFPFIGEARRLNVVAAT